jgi:hypothetical protein
MPFLCKKVAARRQRRHSPIRSRRGAVHCAYATRTSAWGTRVILGLSLRLAGRQRICQAAILGHIPGGHFRFSGSHPPSIFGREFVGHMSLWLARERWSSRVSFAPGSYPVSTGPWDAPRWPLWPEIYSQTVHKRPNPFPIVESVTADFQPRSANVDQT